MKILNNGDWGLRLLALVLAIVIYHTLKNESVHNGSTNDRPLFEQH